MMTNKELLKVAQRQIGKNGAKFRSYVGVGGSWCDMFVFWLFDANGCGSLLPWKGNQRYYCPASIKWCEKNLAEIPMYLAMACDIVYFDWDKNGNPNHIGICEKRRDTKSIYTIEGNTSGGIVDDKCREGRYVQSVFRPHFVGSYNVKKPLTIDGKFGYSSIAMLQKALGIKVDGVLGKATVRALQTKAGTDPDGCWRKGTSLKVQKMIGAKADGEFGEESVKKLQEWCNDQVFTGKPAVDPPKKKKTNAEKIIAKIDEYAWPYKTPKKKWQYKTGHAKTTYKEALHKYMHKKARISQSDCGYFVSTPIRATGIDKNFDCLKGYDWDYSKKLEVVHKGGRIKKGELKPGDIIRYKKTSGQHTMFYYGHGKIAEAQRGHAFPKIKKDRKKYNRANVKKNTIQVLRAKG